MKIIHLCGSCRMRAAGEETEIPAEIPGSVATALLACGRILDPYDRNHEEQVLPVFDQDYIFTKEFEVRREDLAHDRVYLVCEGLDTICDITLNGEPLASTKNMFVNYRLDVKERLRTGKNKVEFYFHSPRRFLQEHPVNLGKPFHVIRKAACMFGWDWGINLPDSGVWKPCYIEGFDAGRLERVDIAQRHGRGRVTLEMKVRCELWTKEGMEVAVSVFAPDGSLVWTGRKEAAVQNEFVLEVEDPRLWWPRGYGGQPLYRVEASLSMQSKEADSIKKQIGLRTVVLNRERDRRGHKYEILVNGVSVYVKGESMVIHDALIPRSTKARWEELVDNCVRSNLNCIRVWGGAYYPPDVFYELCDLHGLLVFQDFMFACTFYYPSDSFMENIQVEVEQQLVRLRDHACICLFCGNNELDCIYTAMTSKEPETVALRELFGAADAFDFKTRLFIRHIYKKIFLKCIPGLCGRLAPQISYVHSSPTGYRPFGAKSIYDYLADGDMHYYLQYNGNAPYQKMRQFEFRFVSELGFQSYPSYKTIKSFTAKEDRSPYTPVMYAHQKCKDGNETIEEYLKREYCVPEDFEDYVYLSQLQAAEIMGYSVEHMRRHNDFNRGVIMWQLNDCWPVCSWSGIDYYGRWKAQQYYTRRFFAPVLVSAEERGLQVDFYVVCDGTNLYRGKLVWALETEDKVLEEGTLPVQGQKNQAVLAGKVNFENYAKYRGQMYLRYHLEGMEEETGMKTVLFCPAKDFSFAPGGLSWEVSETDGFFEITVESQNLVKGVMFDLMEGENRALLIDTGTGEGNLSECIKKLTDKPVLVVNTHGHYDHMGGNHFFAEIHLHPADKEVAASHQDSAYLSQMIRKMTSGSVYLLAKIWKPFLLNPRPTRKFADMADGQIFDLGNRKIEVWHTPGHTKGSVCLYDHKYDLLFTGDSICRHLVLLGGMDFCDKPEAYVEALQRLQKRVTPKTVLYSNHHENPVPQEYIQKYITCATKIMERPEEGVKMKYGAGLWDVMVYEDVKLTFDR